MINNFLSFSNRVARRLFAMGYSVREMPPAHIFGYLCNALKEKNYSPDEAANLIYAAFHDDRTARCALLKKVGTVALLLFGPLTDD